jgi:hypothetical protein
MAERMSPPKTFKRWPNRCYGEGVTPDDIVERLIQTTPTKEDELTHDARFQKIFAS